MVDKFTYSFFTFFIGIRDTLRLVHVQKLATEALQDIRIQYRWEAIELENTLLTVSRVAKDFGLEKATVNQWVQFYVKYGDNGLVRTRNRK